MQYDQDQSDIGRERQMTTVLEHIQQDPLLGQELFTPKISETLSRVLPEFSEARLDSLIALANRQDLISRRDAKQATLDRVIRHFWSGLENRTQRSEHSPKVLRLYRTTGDAGRPDLVTSRGILMQVQHLIQGEVSAIDQGYPAMANPDIKEVELALVGFKELVLAKEKADLTHAKTQNTLSDLRGEVETVLRHIVSQTKMALESKPASYVRRVLRNLGFSFKNGATDPISFPTEDEISPTDGAGETSDRPGLKEGGTDETVTSFTAESA